MFTYDKDTNDPKHNIFLPSKRDQLCNIKTVKLPRNNYKTSHFHKVSSGKWKLWIGEQVLCGAQILYLIVERKSFNSYANIVIVMLSRYIGESDITKYNVT